jgi:murein DD-endopeptidase MepM/ murein hydrolase activator NlpD
VEQFVPDIEQFMTHGVHDFEIHGEPNLAARGCGISWTDAATFSEWFVAVAHRLREMFGAQVRVGFPGLTPDPPRLGPKPVIDQATFLTGSEAAIEEADFVCCHVYWDSAASLRSPYGALRFAHQYLERFPTMPLVISEFASVGAGIAKVTRGAQYAEFLLACSQYDECHYDWPWNQTYWPRLQAAYGFILRSSDPAYQDYAWIDGGGGQGAILDHVRDRSHMPAPTALRLTWPTEYRDYTQFYGENQLTYYKNSYANSLRGGHNGVDLHVDYHDPASSPIFACLPGVVTETHLLETGYGHHILVESTVDGVGRMRLLYGHMTHIFVEEGQEVRAGETLGTAGLTGATTGPHLHLSLKIEGIDFPGNGNHLNARPYLDPLPVGRGEPRVDYARTYVLLPPNAGTEWARAVVDATWQAHRLTVGGSADDAGLGDLSQRRVIAINPNNWNGDLETFFVQHYPGVIYCALEAERPDVLIDALGDLPALPSRREPADGSTDGERGQPRVDYARTYVLLPPGAGSEWAQAVVDGSWDEKRFTLGGSADDGGVGDLSKRRVIAVNPSGWEGDLAAFYATHYPGIRYTPLTASGPQELADQLARL